MVNSPEGSSIVAIFDYLLSESSMDYKKDSGDILELIRENFFEYEDIAGQQRIIIKRIPYEDLASRIFNDQATSQELNERFMIRIEELTENCNSDEEVVIQRFGDKVFSHIQLSKVQKQYMDDRVAEAIEKSAQSINNLNESIEITKTRAQNIYGEFIGILGIFSALIFGLFSGFSVLTSAISDFSKGVPLGNSIIYISIIAMALLTFVYFLLDWVGILIQRPIHHEKLEVKEDQYSNVQNILYRLGESLSKGRKTPRDLTFVEKHRTYIFLMELLIVTCLIGVIVSVIQQQITPNYLSMIFSIILCLVPLYFIIKHIISSIRRKDDN